MRLTCIVISFLLMIANNTHPSDPYEVLRLGHIGIEGINQLLSHGGYDKSARIERISKFFKGIPYNDKTLIGSKDTKEIFVINLEEMDCFTYIDYVEALSRSDNFDEFKQNLKKVRYREGKIDFLNRRHFFTDWAFDKDAHATDVTTIIAGDKAISAHKTLNLKATRRFYLVGLPVVHRTITYIPTKEIDSKIIDRLKTGDYIGIYTHDKGLDVSHVGILIKDENGKPFFRHASSLRGKVVQHSFTAYMRNKAGIVVLRTT
ncbi:MAG: N-acetylmuramoyl-L-alanine amidase-like domain-containing protein [Thermodesulfovibrionales bacterium]